MHIHLTQSFDSTERCSIVGYQTFQWGTPPFVQALEILVQNYACHGQIR